MKIVKKCLAVPYVPALDGQAVEHINEQMDSCGNLAVVECVDWPQEFSYMPITEFAVAHTDTMLYIKYMVKGSMLKAVFSNDMDPVWQDSCVEFFCQLPEHKEYMNFEFNCIGTCLATTRTGRDTDIVPRTPAELASIVRYSSIGRRAFCEMEGHFEWELTVGIPFELLGFSVDTMPDKLRANFYKCADDTNSKHYVSWSPIDTPTPDFHCPEFFGELIFEKHN